MTQVRFLVVVPLSPHETEQPAHGLQSDQAAGTNGQSAILQLPAWVAWPGQSSPPFVGGGELHSRLRTRWPMSQVKLHPVQLLHAPQPPFVGTVENGVISIFGT